MLNKIGLENILFLDIETVPQYSKYSEMPEKLRYFWDKKALQLNKEKSPEELYGKAGIYAEFGKIICISFGYIRRKKDELGLFIKSIYGDNEREVLIKFNSLLQGYYNSEKHFLCAHNGKEFDFPYIARRSLINRIQLADILNTPGAKPWEVKHLDTLELWKFGDYKHWTSLDLLTAIFDIPSSKDDIDGSMVNEIYWQNADLQRIVEYCQKDVVALAQLYLRYLNKPLIKNENIFIK